ncbi:MAG: hypothetical protein V2B15_13500 [Bacteroidota bacterium]
MKHLITLFSGAFLLSSCSSANRIFVNQDDFKDQSTFKLIQPIKGYSDELRRGLQAPYRITLKHFYSENDQRGKDYVFDVSLKTKVRAYKIEPVLYFSMDGKKIRLEPDEQITKVFQAGSSSSSSETNTATKEDPDNKDEAITETTTTYTTSSSLDTYQLMQMRFHPDLSLMKEIRRTSDVIFKIYIDNEGIEIPFRRRYKRKYNKYIDLIEG